MTLKLRVVEGNAAGTSIAVEDELVIGRTASIEGRLADDPEISRQHARVSRSGGGYVVEDLGSMNGTFVNGSRLHAPHQLTDGDKIEVGGTCLMAQPERDLGATPGPGTAIPQQEEWGATRVADVPSDLPAAPAETELGAPAPAAEGDTFVPPQDERAAAEPQAAEPQAPAGPEAPPESRAPAPPPPPPPEPAPAPPEPTPAPEPPAPPPPPPVPADMPPPTGLPQDTELPPPVPTEESPAPPEESPAP